MLLIKNSAASFSLMWKTLPINFLNLFNEAIQYASTIPEISDSDKAIIKHSRKTLLFHNNQHLEKNLETQILIFLSVGYDGAEICELVGIFILTKLKAHFKIHDITTWFYKQLQYTYCLKR